jgi:copper(I)-binding protein
MRRVLGALMLSLATTSFAWAGEIEVKDAVARATPPGAPVGGIYLTIHNSGQQADRLIKADTPVADQVELHSHSTDGGVARMQAVSEVAVPAGQSVLFQPGGLHVMLRNLKAPLRAGESFPLTLTFARAGDKTVEVSVKEISALIPQAGHGHHGHGGHKH